MRIREPKTTALIFASGKMVVTGAKSEDDSKLASRKYARIIQKLGFNAKFTDFKIQNIVGSCDIKFPIRLEGLASRHHNFSSYEPELFPGLIYRMIKPKIVLLIFVSGKIVLTGAKVREEIYQAFEMIYPVLQGEFLSVILIRPIYPVPDSLPCRFPQGLNTQHGQQGLVATSVLKVLSMNHIGVQARRILPCPLLMYHNIFFHFFSFTNPTTRFVKPSVYLTTRNWTRSPAVGNLGSVSNLLHSSIALALAVPGWEGGSSQDGLL